MIGSAHFFQVIVDGITLGASYAILALAFSMLWATVRTVNVALLQTMMVAGIFSYLGAYYGLVPAFFIGLIAGVSAGIGSHYVAVASTINRGLIFPIVASLGLGVAMKAIASIIFSDDIRPVPDLLPQGGIILSGVYIGWDSLITVCVIAALITPLMLVMRYSRLGLAFRATSWAPDLANSYGVNVRAIRLLSAAAAAVSASLAGIFAVLNDGSVSPALGAHAGLTGLVAMLIGGAGNLPGAVVGGLSIGIIEAASGVFISSAAAQAVSYGVLFFIMVFKPSGLMKER